MRKRLPHSRVIVDDLMYFQRQIPLCTHVRSIALAEVAQLRRSSSTRISWCVLFVKAYAAVARDYPQLRQIYLRWPWPHLYEHPFSVATVSIHRRLGDEDWLFFALLYRPEDQTLRQLQSRLDWYQSSAVQDCFPGQLRLSRLPAPVRRIWWWVRLNLMPPKRVKRLGTFGLTTLAGQGTTIVDPKSPLSSIVSYGPLNAQGRCDVSVTYDHRLLDGHCVAEFLADLEVELGTRIRDELATLQGGEPSTLPYSKSA